MGVSVGNHVEITVAKVVGSSVGVQFGILDGIAVSEAVGKLERLTVGDSNRLLEGDDVCCRVGNIVGDAERKSVGSTDGDPVG